MPEGIQSGRLSLQCKSDLQIRSVTLISTKDLFVSYMNQKSSRGI